MRTLRVLLPLFATAGVVACGADRATSDEHELIRSQDLENALLGVTDEGILQRIGTSDGEAWFSHVVNARVAAESNLVIVQAADAPYIRVFRNGQLEARFMERGSGPGEGRILNGLAVAEDRQLIAVTHDGRLSEFDYGGALVSSTFHEYRRPFAIQGGCPAGWIAISPDRTKPAAGPAVHVFPYGGTGNPMPIYTDSADVVHLLGPGGPASVHRVQQGVLVEYGYSSKPWIAEVDCVGGVRRIEARPVTASVQQRLDRLVGSEGRVPAPQLTENTRIPAGFLHDRGHVVILESGLNPVTEIKLFRDGQLWREVIVPLQVALHDYDAEHGVVLSLSDPFPQVIVVEVERWWEWLLEDDGEVLLDRHLLQALH